MTLPADLVDDPMFEVISRLSDCLCEELAAAHGPALCYCGLWVGASAPPLGIGGCTDGAAGVAWVRLVRAYPSQNFPAPDDVTLTPCSGRFAYEVEIGVGRPAPAAVGREMYPDKQALFEAQRLYMSDLRAMKRSLLCCLPAEQKRAGAEVLVKIGDYTAAENSAQRSGGTFQGYIGWA